MQPIYNLPKHLGGHRNKTHIDESTLDYLIKHFNIKNMYDIGCGPGGMVKEAAKRSIDAVGIDGDFTLQFPKDLKIMIHDFTKGPLDLDPVDLGWSCEFLEHVEEKYIPNYFSVFKKCRVICCTFSTSKTGYHHVNVKNQEYWDQIFLSYKFNKDIISTDYIRKNSSMKRNFVRLTGTVYINNL